MATISERLAYVLTFDTSSGVKSLDQFGKAADKNLDKSDKLDKLGTSMVKFGAGAVAFAGVAGAGLVAMAQGAADAEANMSALEQVVGEVVANDIGTWAEDSAKGVGMASKDAVSAATTFAQLGKIIGLGGEELGTFSTDLVGLSADFAAFKNVAPEQALQDIQAAFAGSTEVMRKYGIFLDDATLKSAYFRETGEKVTGTLTAQQKIVAINAEMYRQGADMIGQWGRESGEMSGQQAILRAELTNLSDAIGAGVLPMLVSVMGVVADVVGAFGSLSPETQSLIGKFAALGVAGVGIIGTLSMVAGQAIKMRDRFSTLGDDGVRSLTRMGTAAKGVGIGMGVAAAALIVFSLRAEGARRAAVDLENALADVEEASDDMAVGEFMDAVREAFDETGDRVLAQSGVMVAALDTFDDALIKVAETSPAVALRMLELEAATGGLSAAMMDQGATAAEAAQYIDLLRTATDGAIAGQQQANETTAAFNEAVEGTTPAVTAASDAVRVYTEHAAGMRAEQEQVAASAEEAWSTWAETTQAALDAAGEAYQSSVDAANAWAEGVRGAVNSGGQSFYDFAVTAETSAADHIAAMQEATAAAYTWEANLATVQSNMTSGTEQQKADFVGYLAEMGEAGAPMVEDLAGNQGELDAMFNEWVVSSELTGDGMIGGLDPVAAEWQKRMVDAERRLKQQMFITGWVAEGEAKKIGTKIPAGMQAGVESGQGALNATIASMVTQALNAAKLAAGIQSPSRKFAEEVGKPIPQGVAEGIDEDSDRIRQSLTRAIESASREAIREAEDFVDAANDVLKGLWDEIDEERRIEDLEKRVVEAQENLTKVMGDYTSTAEDKERAEDRLKDAAYALAKATIEMTDKDFAARESWKKTAKQAGLTTREISDLVEAYEALAVAQDKTTKDVASIEGQTAARIAKIEGRATGGPLLPGRTYEVGEHGREIIQMGTGSGNVVTASAVGGGGMDAKAFGREAAREFAKTLQHERRAI